MARVRSVKQFQPPSLTCWQALIRQFLSSVSNCASSSCLYSTSACSLCGNSDRHHRRSLSFPHKGVPRGPQGAVIAFTPSTQAAPSLPTLPLACSSLNQPLLLATITTYTSIAQSNVATLDLNESISPTFIPSFASCLRTIHCWLEGSSNSRSSLFCSSLLGIRRAQDASDRLSRIGLSHHGTCSTPPANSIR